ncbi:MAG: LacI family DNA-binding transcriptional regulator [Atopobiaceae bacterium]
MARRAGQTRPVSAADVARAAGVSQQTVSRVVNNQPNVSERTRKAVTEAMEELGFRPNFAGRSLRSGRYHSVGLSIYNITQYGNLSTLDGIASAARSHGYAITMEEERDDSPISLEVTTRRMLALPVDAMIASMSIKAGDFETYRPAAGLGCVLLTMYPHPSCTTVDSDQYGCSRLVMDHLLAHGHQEIRFVAGPSFSVDSRFREKGWRDALEEHSLPVAEPIAGDWTADSGYEAGCLLAKDEKATAIYAANDQMALGVICALEDAGKSVPDDVSVVGVDDSLGSMVPKNRLTTVRFDMFQRGTRAFEEALKAGEPGYEVQAIRIPGTLIERSTVRDIR